MSARPTGTVRLRPKRVPLWRVVFEDVVLPVVLAALLTVGLLVVLIGIASR